MAGKAATEELQLLDTRGGAHSPARGGGEFERNGGEGGWAAPAIPQRIYLTGICLALAGILMFFMALTSSYIVRKGLSNDWVPVELPRLLWWNTAVLLVSSLTIERARRLLVREHIATFRYWWKITIVLGTLFLAGQVVAWRQLASAGVYLATNPSSSFFYLLTGTHGVHLLGGIVGLLYVGFRNWAENARLRRRTAAMMSTIYWHFMDALWVFIFLLLLLRR